MRAQTFEMDLLAINDKAFVMSCRHGKRYIGQAMCAAAVCAREVSMALLFGASMCKLEVPSSLVYESLVNQACFDETFECSIDCNLVKVSFAGFCSNFFLTEGLSALK